MAGSSTLDSPSGEAGSRTARSPGIDFFSDALQGALALVHADGGEIAMLDPARHTLLARARATHPAHPHYDAAASPVTTSAYLHANVPPSLPPSASSAGQARASRSARDAGPPSRLPAADGRGGEIETQSTMVLHAGTQQRSYRLGEGLIGLVAQRREPLILGRDDYRKLARGLTGPDLDANWHMAVPIFRAGPLASPHADTGLLGVITVYNRDPHWSFTDRDVELLVLHADRVARALALEEMRRRTRAEGELLETLRAATSAQDLFGRARDAGRHMLEAPSFAVARLLPSGNEIVFEAAERDGKTVAPLRVPLRSLPAWWGAVSRRQAFCVSSAEERAAFAQHPLLGWGGDQPVQSLVAAPLVRGASLYGAIVAGNPRSDAYGPEEVEAFEALAHAMATALEDAQRATAQARSEPLAALINAVMALSVSLDLERTVQTLANLAAQLTSAQAAVVFLRDEADKHCLVARARSHKGHAGIAEEEPAGGVILPLQWSYLRGVMDSGQWLPLEHLESEWADESDVGQFLAHEQIASAVVVPILHQAGPSAGQPAETLGILMVYTPGQRQPFPGQGMSQEVTKLQVLASQAATAINNAMLFHRQQEVDRLKDEFILTISHEFRTPLTTIDGYVSLLERHRDKLDGAKIAQFTLEIRQASKQLAGMVGMLGDAAQLSDQPLKVALGPVKVHEAASRALSTQPLEAKARVTLAIPEQLTVYADAERLPNIFSNLIGNALKYAPEGPIQITARTESRESLARQGRSVAIEHNAAPQWVVISVRDQGPGIAAEDMDKLFKKFVRLTKSLTTSVRGTGLGLWICKEYVKAMGGEIWVESEINQGANFQFCLPVALTAGTTNTSLNNALHE